MKNIVIKKSVDLYGFEFKVCFDRDAYFNLINTKKEDRYYDWGGITYADHNSHTYIICVPLCEDGYLDLQVLCHESYHLADFLFDRVGMEYNRGSGNEHMAYLIDYILSQVVDAHKIYKKIIAKK